MVHMYYTYIAVHITRRRVYEDEEMGENSIAEDGISITRHVHSGQGRKQQWESSDQTTTSQCSGTTPN